MKRSIVVAAMAIGLACVGTTGIAQEAYSSHLGHVIVTAAPNQFKTYVVDLDTGYGLQILVGNSHRQFMQAQRVAESLEALRKQGMAQAPFVTVAVDNSSGSGLAKRFILSDPSQGVVAVVDTLCQQPTSMDHSRCLMIPRPVPANASGARFASRGAAKGAALLQLAAIGVH